MYVLLDEFINSVWKRKCWITEVVGLADIGYARFYCINYLNINNY